MIGGCFCEINLQNSNTLFNLWGIVTVFQNIDMLKNSHNPLNKLLITPQNPVSKLLGNAFLLFHHWNFSEQIWFSTSLFDSVDSGLFTVQKAASWAKIGIVKGGRSRRSRSQSSAALETGCFCSKQWKTMFPRAKCSLYTGKLILGN